MQQNNDGQDDPNDQDPENPYLKMALEEQQKQQAEKENEKNEEIVVIDKDAELNQPPLLMADGFQSSDSDDEIGHYNNQDKNNNDDDEINETSNAQIEKELQRCGSLDLDMDKEESEVAKVRAEGGKVTN